jgi:hypothetical protein
VIHHDLSSDGKSESGAALVAVTSLIEPGKPLEDPLPKRGRNSRTIIRDGQFRGSVRRSELDDDGAGGVSLRIVEQVGHHSLELIAVSQHPGRVDLASLDSMSARCP